MLSFTAPTAGYWTLDVVPDLGDAQITFALRDACGLGVVAHEIACATGTRAYQGHTVSLGAGATVYAVIGGGSERSDDGSLGPFTLVATREAR